MVRAPCCEKMGLKKGPWTPQEDQILISHIENYGHGNWRALPKQAGLLRCGKSCRLRWTNYLRPDIKRGNFTKEEEEAIIKLHQMMGNRWSAIAAKLPGRTDNEIKNVWHTHLKKRLLRQQNQDTPNAKSITKPRCKRPTSAKKSQPIDPNFPIYPGSDRSSPQQSFSDFSSVTESSFISGEAENSIKDEEMDFESFPLIDESFWSDSSSAENSSMISELSTKTEIQFSSGSLVDANGSIYGFSSMNEDDDLNFWYNIFVGVGDLRELPEF